MTRIDRHVLRLFALGLTGSLAFFLGLYLVIHFFNRLDRIDDLVANFKDAGWDPWYGFCRYYGSQIPFVAVEILPFAVLAAGMWTGQSLARRNEITAALTTGISMQRLGMPILLGAAVIALGLAALKEVAFPALAPVRHEVEQVARGRSDPGLRGIDLLRDGKSRLVVIQAFDVANDVATGVIVRASGNPLDPGLELPSMRWRQDDTGGVWLAEVESDRGERIEVPVPIDLLPYDIEIASRSLMFLPVEDLERVIERNPERPDIRVHLHAQYAFPLRVLVLLLCGLPLVLWPAAGSPYLAVGSSILLSMGFFAVQNVTAELGRRGEFLEPVAAVWLPIALFGIVGAAAYVRMRS